MLVAHCSEDGRIQPLEDHLSRVSSLAADYASTFHAQDWAAPIGMLHDVGKSADGPQRRILHNGPRADHSTAGSQAVKRVCGKIGAYCVAGHHGGLPDGGSAADHGEQATLHGRLNKKLPLNKAYIDSIASALKPPASPPFPIDVQDSFAIAFLTRMLFSCLVDADWTDTGEFMNGESAREPAYDSLAVIHERLALHLQGMSDQSSPINRKRASILTDCRAAAAGSPGLYSLTVPTGGGKTLSSLAFALEHALAHGLERIIYVIPYVSIIEQNARVFRTAIGDHNVVEHHANVSFSDDNGERSTWHLAQENWDAPLIVTTNVQFFESLFSARPGRCRKLHNIARSVVIFDEAQMIPLPYLIPCVNAISELVSHYGTTAVLMSATQPALRPFFPQDMPLTEITSNPSELYEFFRRTTLVHLGEIDDEQLLKRMLMHEQALAIVNTRKHAQQLYAQLPSECSFHLSTLMHPTHRRRVLNQVRERLKQGQSCFVVSTSLIEAGVDVDFAAVYREEAGLDSIIQAAGRCNREGKRSPEDSVAAVFRSAQARSPMSMDQQIHSARLAMDAHEDMASLEAIHDYFRALYQIRGDGLDQNRIMDAVARDAAALSFPFRQIEKAFTLIDNQTYSVIIATDEEAAPLIKRLRAGEHSRGLLRELGQFTVNVYRDHATALYEAGVVEPLGEDGFLLTRAEQYDPDIGLKLAVDQGIGVFV